jgi:hypothetical protein
MATMGLVMIAMIVGLAALPAGAADHLDAPGLTPPGGDLRLDITDVYVFGSPECDNCATVLAMGVNGLTAPGVQATFAADAVYEFKIDNDDKNALENWVFRVKFGEPDANGVQSMEVRLASGKGARSGSGGRLILSSRHARTTGLYEEPVVNIGRWGVHAFAGMRDDPFFFDLPGFLTVATGPGFCASDPAPDTFAGTNVGYIVLEVPNWILGSINQIGVWSATSRGGAQVDRMGRPAINTVFIPNNPLEPAGSEPSQKNAFNAGRPEDDQANFRAEVVDTLEIFYGAGSATAQALADILLPDVLTYELGTPAAFLNGRAPADDVIDAELGIVTNGAITTDCVDANDVPFAATFPYLAGPHMP